MNSSPGDPSTTLLAEGIRTGASSDQIADLIAQACQDIEAALTPIIGQRGVAALFKRSQHLAAQTYPWLSVPAESAPAAADVDALKLSLARRTSVDAAAAGLLVLKTFNDLLVNLIGASLTGRLLRPVWASFLSGKSARDTTS